jgi:hypothetical protein
MHVEALLCSNSLCRNEEHLKVINNYTTDITDACIQAASDSIPLTCERAHSGRLPSWTECVQPLRDKALFWHRLWMDCDRPKTEPVADSMRRS